MNMRQVTIAAVNGFALGGGCEISMACDIRIASDNATFAQPETGLGIIPGFGGTQRLARLVGMGRAKEMIFTCDSVDAAEAYRIGLVNKVVAPEELMNTAKAMAKKIISKGSYAVSVAKAAINNGYDMDIKNAVEMEVAAKADVDVRQGGHADEVFAVAHRRVHLEAVGIVVDKISRLCILSHSGNRRYGKSREG